MHKPSVDGDISLSLSFACVC